VIVGAALGQPGPGAQLAHAGPPGCRRREQGEPLDTTQAEGRLGCQQRSEAQPHEGELARLRVAPEPAGGGRDRFDPGLDERRAGRRIERVATARQVEAKARQAAGR
jgi:hypothetical protein